MTLPVASRWISVLRISMFAISPILWAALSTPLFGEQFRIETSVYVGEEPVAISHSVTLFDEGVVYDFLDQPASVAVFKKSTDQASGRFMLLNTAKRMRSEMSTERIQHYMTGLKSISARSRDSLIQFAGNPTFQTRFDSARGELTMQGAAMNYRVLTTEAPSDAALQQFRDFSDSYAQLGAMLSTGSLPPFARLELNQSLAENKVVPREVRLTLLASKPKRNEDIVIRSEHTLTWRLSRQDRDQIDSVNRQLVEFQEVDFETFRRAE